MRIKKRKLYERNRLYNTTEYDHYQKYDGMRSHDSQDYVHVMWDYKAPDLI